MEDLQSTSKWVKYKSQFELSKETYAFTVYSIFLFTICFAHQFLGDRWIMKISLILITKTEKTKTCY